VDGTLYNSFKAAYHTHGIISYKSDWVDYFNKAKDM